MAHAHQDTVLETLGKGVANITVNIEGTPATSSKSWARSFELDDWKVMSISLTEYERPQNFFPLDQADNFRLRTPFKLSEAAELALSEGDVSSFFWVYIAHPVRMAYSLYPRLEFRSLATSPEPKGNVSMVVDFMVYDPQTERAVTIGELKTPGIINFDEWAQIGTRGRGVSAQPSSRTDKLGRELAGYAYHYNCPQVFCFDGATLLVLRFNIRAREDLLNIATRNPSCWVIPIRSTAPNVTVRRALYSTIRDGYQRIQGEYDDENKIIDGLQCGRVPCTGRVYWNSPQGPSFYHPRLTVKLNIPLKRWEWVDMSNRVVKTEDDAL